MRSHPRLPMLLLAILLVIAPALAAGGELQRRQLDNGLEVLLKEAHGGPMVASIVTVGAGSRFEDETSFGASHFLEHMVFNGTATRSREDINEGIKDYGGYINAFTRREYTCYILLIPTEYLREGLEIQADMLFGSILPEDEFEKEKLVVIEEMKKDYDSGSYRGQLYQNERVLGGTPFAHPVLGTVDTIRGLTREQVLGYYRERYRPSNCRMFLVGDFQPRETMKLLGEVFGAHEDALVPPPPGVSLPWPDAPDYVLYRAEEGKPSLDLYWPAPPVREGGYPAQLVLATLLSDEHRSPLRQGDGSPLDLGVSIELFEDFSLLHLGVDPGETDPAEVLSLLARRLRALADWAPDAALVAEAARGLRVEEVFLQDTYHYYAMMKSAELHLGGYEFLSGYRRDLQDMSAAAVRAELERSLLAAPPRLIWSDQSGGLEELPPELEAGFTPVARELALAAAPRKRPRRARENLQRPRRSRREERRAVLGNGLTVLVKSDPSSEVFAAHLLVRGRSLREPEGRAGMVALAHRLLDAGTARHSGEEIAGAISALGARLKTSDNPWIPFDNYYTREDFSWLRLQALDESSDEALALLAEMVGEASYPEAAVEAEKGRMLAAHRMGGSRPIEEARQEHSRWLFAGGTRGEPLTGTAQSIAAIDAEALRAFHAEYFDPGQMILSVVTSRPASKILGQVRRHFSALAGSPGVLPPSELSRGPAELVLPMEKEQVALLARRVVPGEPEDEGGLRVLVDVLSARMALELRERQGLAYSLGAGLRFVPGLADGESGFGLITLQISTGAENRERARVGMLAELTRLRDEPPGEQEIFRAVNGRWGRELMRNLSRIHQAYRLGLAEHRGEDPFAESRQKVASQRQVRSEDLARLAEDYLLQDDWVWVLAGGGLE